MTPNIKLYPVTLLHKLFVCISEWLISVYSPCQLNCVSPWLLIQPLLTVVYNVMRDTSEDSMKKTKAEDRRGQETTCFTGGECLRAPNFAEPFCLDDSVLPPQTNQHLLYWNILAQYIGNDVIINHFLVRIFQQHTRDCVGRMMYIEVVPCEFPWCFTAACGSVDYPVN